MKYFITEDVRKATGSTCFFEFQKGKYHNKCWLPDSISIENDVFDELKLYEIIKTVIPDFDYYGLTEISRNSWDRIVKQAIAVGGKAEEAITEANEWAMATYSEYSVITICGI